MLSVGDPVFRFSNISWKRHVVAEVRQDKRHTDGVAIRIACESRPLTARELRKKKRGRVSFECHLDHVPDCLECLAKRTQAA